MTYINIFAGKLQIPLKDEQEQPQETLPVKTTSNWKEEPAEAPKTPHSPKPKEVCEVCGLNLRLKTLNDRLLCEGCLYVESKKALSLKLKKEENRN